MAGRHPSVAALLAAAILSYASTAAAASPPIVSENSTLLSPNSTFELGFFTPDGGAAWYLAVWYASIPIRTYVWVANRASPARSLPSAVLTRDGLLSVSGGGAAAVWSTDNSAPAVEAHLLDTGNLVLLSSNKDTVWQSFDHPADTWLPEMAVTRTRPLVSWRSPSDPSPGPYTLRLRPPEYGEFELVFNGSVQYWATGNWTGGRFSGVPEMTVPYIYDFRFLSPFTPDAAFVYSETEPPGLAGDGGDGGGPLLTRFVVDPSGQVMQYTWSRQAASWNMFWSRPEDGCRPYGRCGSLGLCLGGSLRPCACPGGLRPADPDAWRSGDYSGGCARGVGGEEPCEAENGDSFSEFGAVEIAAAVAVSFPGSSRKSCEDSCRRNCSCFGLTYSSETTLCRNLLGNGYNLRNSTAAAVLYLRVPASTVLSKTNHLESMIAVLVGCICGSLLLILLTSSLVVVLKRRWRRRRRGADDVEFPVTNLKVFTYKELSAATRGFSEKLGHGGFGAVFRGDIPPGPTAVAVKRLERPGGGEGEFRAEVRTIGSVQHVNLVRLRGFCSEEAHRLLVYDYMPNGPLSAYLGREPPPPRRRRLAWAARYRVAVGTARGIAYLHESCRDCIIHCDIKPENILLDGEYTAKVSDFGLAKLLGRDLSRVLATMRGTWGYVAPEWISGTSITAKADVYSYGMTLLEIIGGRRNAEAPAAEGEGWFFPPWAARRIVEGDVAAVVDPGLAEMGGYDEAEAERAGRVAVWCIQDEEAARPTMGEVVKMLEAAVAVEVPPLPELLQALVAGDSFRRVGIESGGVSGVDSDGSGLVESGSFVSIKVRHTG